MTSGREFVSVAPRTAPGILPVFAATLDPTPGTRPRTEDYSTIAGALRWW
jgi:hypothetical protein